MLINTEVIFMIFHIVKYLLIILCTISFSTCKVQNHQMQIECTTCLEFINIANKENIELFDNCYLVPRGTYSDGSPKISVIQIKTKSDIEYTFPIGENLQDRMKLSEEQWFAILQFSQTKGISEQDSAYKFVIEYTNEIVRLYKKLKLFEVHSFPHLGKFTEFKISEDDYLIYCEDTTEVYSKYWKNFFKIAPKYGDKFFYKKEVQKKE